MGVYVVCIHDFFYLIILYFDLMCTSFVALTCIQATVLNKGFIYLFIYFCILFSVFFLIKFCLIRLTDSFPGCSMPLKITSMLLKWRKVK